MMKFPSIADKISLCFATFSSCLSTQVGFKRGDHERLKHFLCGWQTHQREPEMQLNESKVNDSIMGCDDFPDVNRIKVKWTV